MAERIFRGFLFLVRRIFSRILSPDFSSSFLWEKVSRKILQEIPGEILRNLHNKNPRHISAECLGQKRAVSSKGGFGKRILVPVFRSGGTYERTLVPVFVPGELNMRMYPRSGFRSGGTSAKTTLFQDDGKGGLSLRGVAFMTVLAVLTVLENTLLSLCWSYKIQDKEAAVTVLAVMAVSVLGVVAVMAVSVLNIKEREGERRTERQTLIEQTDRKEKAEVAQQCGQSLTSNGSAKPRGKGSGDSIPAA